MRCPKQATLVMCTQGKEVEVFDTFAQLIVEEMEDGKLPKLTALQLMERLERLYYRLHEYTTTEEDWLY
jgi:hypothetical protein